MILSALEKTTVLDCSVLLPGPYCTMMLAELGANVLKIERPGLGDGLRRLFPGYFSYLNGNKRLITLDFKKREGHDLFLNLARESDVVVEAFRPGVAAQLGIDFDSVKEANPCIIYCSISGYGQTGPYANLPGHDINYQGLTGLFGISGDPESGPEFPYGFPVADLSGAMFALVSILAALLRPKDSSSAIYLDVSMTESLAMWMMPQFLEYVRKNRPSKKEFMGRAAYGIFETRDGKHLSLGAFEDHFWINLCNALGFDDLASDETLNNWHSRNSNRDRIVPRLKAAIKMNDLDFWVDKLSKADVPVAPVTDFDNWMDNPQLRHRDFFPRTKQGTVDLGNLRRFPVTALVEKNEEGAEETALGRDTWDVLRELGMESDKIGALKEAGII